MNFGDSNKIDKDLPENKRGEFSNKLELSRLVEPTGRRSNEFEEDLKKLIKFQREKLNR